MQKKKKEANEILSKYKPYQFKKDAVNCCTRVSNSDQVIQSLVLCKWMFETPDGIMIISESLIRCVADIGSCIYKTTTRSTNNLIMSNGSRKRKISNGGDDTEFPSMSGIVKDSGNVGNNPKMKLLSDVFRNAVVNRLNIEIRTCWRWLSNMLFICPWGACMNYTLVPVKNIDIRCKEAIAAMIHSRAWTSTEYCDKSATCVAGAFAYNHIGQEIYEKKGVCMLMVAFPLLLVSQILTLIDGGGLVHFFTENESNNNVAESSETQKNTARSDFQQRCRKNATDYFKKMIHYMFFQISTMGYKNKNKKTKNNDFANKKNQEEVVTMMKTTYYNVGNNNNNNSLTKEKIDITRRICLKVLPKIIDSTPIVLFYSKRQQVIEQHISIIKKILLHFLLGNTVGFVEGKRVHTDKIVCICVCVCVFYPPAPSSHRTIIYCINSLYLAS